MADYKIVDHLGEFDRKNNVALEAALARMALDVKQISQQTVPLKSGDLHQSGEIIHKGPFHYEVWYGRNGDPGNYAAVQEQGRRSGASTFEKYTTPGTGAHFLANAGKRVAMLATQYVRQAARRINV